MAEEKNTKKTDDEKSAKPADDVKTELADPQASAAKDSNDQGKKSDSEKKDTRSEVEKVMDSVAKEKEESKSGLTLDISEKTTAEQIVQEVKRSLRFYVKEAGSSDFRKILLVGGGSKLIGLPEYIADHLNIPTEVFNPFINLELPDKLRDQQDPQLALAIGLAMRPE